MSILIDILWSCLIDILWSCLMTFGLFWGGIILSLITTIIIDGKPENDNDPKYLFKIAVKGLSLVSMIAGVCLYIVLFK